MFFTKRVHLFWAAAVLALVLLSGPSAPAAAQQPPDESDGSRQLKLSGGAKAREDEGSRQLKIGESFAGSRAPRQQPGTWKGAAQNRQPAARTAAAPKPRRVYRHVNAAARRRTTPPPAAGAAKPRYEEVGVTVWRLRKARAGDDGPKLQGFDGGEWWTPERVEGTTPLNVGDRVRLSIESPREGYLYVISTDQYADGTTGTPRLIFPTTRTRGGDNRVTPGRLVDIPSHEDDTSFFTVTSDRRPGQPRQVAEVLTVIVARAPVAELANNSRGPLELKAEQVAAWERQWGGETDLFELKDGAGVAWSKAEQEASRNDGGRSLTQEEPTPQTIYSVQTRPNSPLLVRVQLHYGQPAAAKN